MTTWRKNEPVALRRKAHLQIFKSDGTPAPRGTDFIALGITYIGGAHLPDLDPAVGTMTNQRRGLVVADDVVEAVDIGADTLQLTAHSLEDGDGPLFLTSTGLVPGGYPIGDGFFAIKVDANNVKMADTLAHAYAGTAINITSTGSGAITLSDGPTTQRGVDGRFVYEATQTETNHDAAEMSIVVDSGTSGDYALKDGAGGSAYVTMGNDASDWSGLLEGDVTRDDALRIILRTHAAKMTKTGNDYVVRDLADTKDSHHGTATLAAGRTVAVIDDPT